MKASKPPNEAIQEQFKNSCLFRLPETFGSCRPQSAGISTEGKFAAMAPDTGRRTLGEPSHLCHLLGSCPPLGSNEVFGSTSVPAPSLQAARHPEAQNGHFTSSASFLQPSLPHDAI